jgi:hypothetical protein
MDGLVTSLLLASGLAAGGRRHGPVVAAQAEGNRSIEGAGSRRATTVRSRQAHEAGNKALLGVGHAQDRLGKHIHRFQLAVCQRQGTLRGDGVA